MLPDLFSRNDEGSSRKELRPHQVKALDLIKSSLRSGKRRVVLSAPVGFGKTLVASRILGGALEKGNRAIFCAPMISLIDQSVAAFEGEGISDIGVMQANHPRTDRLAKVQVASVQTLARRDIPEASLVVVDECHIKADVIDALMDERPDCFFVGLSATPWSKGMGLRWQDLVIPCTIAELVDGGYLSQSRVLAPDVPDLSRVRIERGDYAEGQLSQVMGDAHLVGNVVATWLELGEARPTLVFGVDRNHARLLHERFMSAGVASEYVDANVDRVMRARIGDEFRAGAIKVICSVRTMTTGVDLPVSCIVDAAPTRSEMLHVQRMGRGMRINPGTEDLLVLDHAGNSLRLGLVGEIEHNRLDCTKPGAKQASQPKAEKLPSPCTGCGTLHTRPACPNCGKERRAYSPVQEAEGSLVEITGRKPQVSQETKQERYAGLLWIARDRGYSKGWAWHKYREWHHVEPANWQKLTQPKPPTIEVLNWVKSRQIAFAKSKRRTG